jgi:hypothetical protein
MLVCVLYLVPMAHETAGAARIRHSLLPHRGRNDRQTSGYPCRENANVYLVVRQSEKPARRPGQASKASADPGPIRRGAKVKGSVSGLVEASRATTDDRDYGSLRPVRNCAPGRDDELTALRADPLARNDAAVQAQTVGGVAEVVAGSHLPRVMI